MFSVFMPTVAQHTGYGVAVAQQNTKVNGVVKDATGEPIIGASVMIKGSGQGTITDFDGKFTLNAKPSQVLVISYVGFSTQEVKVNANVNVVLQEDAAALDEVVVMGYGAAARKQDLSASVGVIGNAEELAIRPVSSTEAMLQGQLAGVTVSSNGGDPTSAPGIVIRGQGSMHGDNVLWVVDGVPGAPIPSMNDIESIVVLKDAASAAIYGATSGAGGCVLVTTKKAQKGATSLAYDGVYGIRQVANMPHALTALEQVDVTKTAYNGTLPAVWEKNVNPYIYTNRTDWMDEIFRTASYQRHNVVLNTGTDVAKNRISYSYDGDNGVLLNTFNNKHTIHYNGSYELNKWVTITEDFTWRNTASNSTNTTSPENGAIMNALHMPSSAPVYNADGTYGGITAPENAGNAGAFGDAINPVRILTASNIYNKRNSAFTSTAIQIHDIIPGLKFTSRFTFDVQNAYFKQFDPIRPELGKPKNFNELTEYSTRYDQWRTENTLTYDNTFGKHTVGGLLSTTADKDSERGLWAYGTGLGDESPTLQYLPFAGSTQVTDVANDKGFNIRQADSNVALIARVAYSYDDRYFFTASWRRDYAGRLPKENNYGDFPAVTAGWKISNESWFPKSENVNLVKVRGSWGRVGNLGSISRAYKAALLSTTNWGEQAQYDPANNALWGNMVWNSTALNKDLTWETSEQTDFGVDLAFLGNRLSASVDYFNKRTFNLIQQQSVGWPGTIGVSAMLVNLGEVKNQGLEMQVGWNDKISKDLSYYVNANFAWLHNEVTDTGTYDEDGNPGIWVGDVYGHNNFKDLTNIFRTTKGEALNSFYLIKSNGVIKTQADLDQAKKAQPDAQLGDLWFVDQNGDNKINDEDRVYCGSSTPKTTFALSAGLTWKNLTVSAMFQGVGGAQTFFAGKRLTLDAQEGGGFNHWNKILDAWSTSNTGSDIPRITMQDTNGNFNTASDWYLENSSYLRLKNLTVGYDLTSQIRKCAHFGNRMSSLYVYVSGENLFTFTGYSGMDPEVGGFDTMKYPVSRVLSFGVKLTY